jgi:hypothetical protein
MLPDRADTAAVVTEAVNKAAEYWGTEFDTEHTELNKLHVADIVITRAEFQELVEARIAIDWADQHADLTRYGGSDNADWFTRSEFIREQREEWFGPIMHRVVTRTRTRRQFETDDLMVAA